MDSFCNVFLKKNFIKCISKKDNKCYLFVGDIPFVKKVINKIKKNRKNEGEGDPFQGIEDKEIDKLYEYLMPNRTGNQGIDLKKTFLRTKLSLNLKEDELIFVYTSINEDDTNETILDKIIYNCYPTEEGYITNPYLYAWYYDRIEKKNIPLSFKYEEETIQYDDFFDKDKNGMIDSSFIDENGDRMPKPVINNELKLSEKSAIRNDTIYFHTLEEYLDITDMSKELRRWNEEEIQQKKELKQFINGLLLKYWSHLSLSDILNFQSEENISMRQVRYEKVKEKLKAYDKHIYMIESEFYREDVNESITCDKYTLIMLKLNKKSKTNNTVHLSKLFREFVLQKEVPFMKLLLNSHDDAFYKLYEKSLLYEGSDKTQEKERYITKDLCKDWSSGYNIQEEYGYRYLHSGNVILFKIYNEDHNIFSSLIIHLNGDIECIIENNGNEISKNEIKVMLNDCNALLSKLNMNQLYAFNTINTLDTDIFTNIHSKTQVEFLNSGILFNKSQFQDKQKRTFPNWAKLLGIFIQNFPMYLRTKTIEETGIDSKIVGRYNRVDDYANITTIQSAIAAYKVIFEDPEIIIQKLSRDYGKDSNFIRNEYETWEELMSMKEDIRRSKVITEGGSEIQIWLNTKEDLLIEIKNMGSFSEQRRIFVFIKTMLQMYLSYIQSPKKALQRKLFQSVNASLEEIFVDEEEEKREKEEEEERAQDVVISSDSGLSDDLEFLGLDEEESGEIGFSDIQGGSSEEMYKVKSYYLDRLKEYDPELFKFKSRKKQIPSGKSYGYPKYCTSTDQRQPIAVNDEDLKRINESSEYGSGRDSYHKSEPIHVPGRGTKVKYICPRYWDISTSLSIHPDEVDESKIVRKLQKGQTQTNKSILERNSNFWGKGEKLDPDTKEMVPLEVDDLFPYITEESKQLHPMGYGLPCCFNGSRTSFEKRKEKKEGEGDNEGEGKKDGYISNRDPITEGKYAHLHPSLLDYFGQTQNTFAKKKGEGFLRMGVRQNDNDYTFRNAPLLQSFVKIVKNEKINSENDLKNEIKRLFKENLNKFQKCPLIHQKFRKNPQNTEEEDNFVMEILDMESTELSFPSKTIRGLRSQMEKELKKRDIKSNEESYLYQLLLSLKNYIAYLESDENKVDKYVLPALLRLFEINIVIFENKNDEIKIKLSEYVRSEKIGFIYQRGNYYEPILYRYYDTKVNEEFQFTPDLLKNNHYEVIFQDIHKKVRENTKESMITEYENVIKTMDTKDKKKDKITTLMIDNYSNVSHLITEKERVIPIPPEPIPCYVDYKYIYSFLEVNDIRPGMNVLFGPKRKGKRDKGKVTSRPFGKKGREKVSVENEEGKVFPSILCRNICFLEEDNSCKSYLPRYENATQYLSYFKGYFTIKSVLLSDDDNITSIIMSNNTYLPVIEEKVQTKYPTEKGVDLLQIENSLYRIKDNEPDKREEFITKLNYERFITKFAFQHILAKIEETTLVNKFIKDSSNYKEGEKINFYTMDFGEIPGMDSEYFIEKLNDNYSPYEKITQVGVIRQILPSEDASPEYPNSSRITIEVKLSDQIEVILKDPIMLIPHKKERLYRIMEPHINPLFYELKEKDYEKYELDKYITLCNEKNELCKYPCTRKGDVCKLYVREKDTTGNSLLEKIKWKFIEKLIIHGIQNREKIIEETISLNELSKSTEFDEIFYTFSEYKNNILDEIFTKKSKYILQAGKEPIGKRRNSFMKKLDTIPYYIQRLFGKDASVIFHLNEKNKDFFALERALNECSIPLSIQSIKEMLIERLKKDDPKLLMTKDVLGDNYQLQLYDFEFIIESLVEKGYPLGIILISQKGNKQKKNDITFTPKDLFKIEDIETVPILSFHHTFYNGEYRLSNILVKRGNELRYWSTIRELYDENQLHEKWIQIAI